MYCIIASILFILIRSWCIVFSKYIVEKSLVRKIYYVWNFSFSVFLSFFFCKNQNIYHLFGKAVGKMCAHTIPSKCLAVRKTCVVYVYVYTKYLTPYISIESLIVFVVHNPIHNT